jgi:hypothetical protein
MKRLGFLVGKWDGEARILRGDGGTVELFQSEESEYKLDGLLLMIEGIGRNKATGKAVLQALGIISYDDDAGTYHLRAYNDGRYLETELKLVENGKGIMWSFTLGDIKTSSTLQINEIGDWTEVHEITIVSQPTRRYMELKVSPRK